MSLFDSLNPADDTVAMAREPSKMKDNNFIIECVTATGRMPNNIGLTFTLYKQIFSSYHKFCLQFKELK